MRHLASSTGKVAACLHRKTIMGGTQRLLATARRAGVQWFVYVSSVAVGFGDRPNYPYADVTREAEARVRDRSCASLIVRPTLHFGPGSAPREGLRRLACVPVPVAFSVGTAVSATDPCRRCRRSAAHRARRSLESRNTHSGWTDNGDNRRAAAPDARERGTRAASCLAPYPSNRYAACSHCWSRCGGRCCRSPRAS